MASESGQSIYGKYKWQMFFFSAEGEEASAGVTGGFAEVGVGAWEGAEGAGKEMKKKVSYPMIRSVDNV